MLKKSSTISVPTTPNPRPTEKKLSPVALRVASPEKDTELSEDEEDIKNTQKEVDTIVNKDTDDSEEEKPDYDSDPEDNQRSQKQTPTYIHKKTTVWYKPIPNPKIKTFPPPKSVKPLAVQSAESKVAQTRNKKK